MSSTEFDLSIPPSAEQIRKREFASVRRGYDADQVREYLKHIADQIEKLELEVHDAKADATAATTAAADANAALQAAVDRARAAERDAQEARDAAAAAGQPEDPYAAFGDRMAEMLRNAEADADKIREQATSERTRLEMDARADADRITTDAQARAEQIRTEAEQVRSAAEEEADRMLAGLRSKKQALKADLEHMRERLLAMADSLETFTESSPNSPGAPTAAAAPKPETTFFSEEQLSELWSGEGDTAGESDATGTTTEAQAPNDTIEGAAPPRFFSEEQLTELWAAEETVAEPLEDQPLVEGPLTDMIDATMADAVEEAPAEAAAEAPTEPPAPPPTIIPPVSSVSPETPRPFFVDETTRPDEETGPGLYPR